MAQIWTILSSLLFLSTGLQAEEPTLARLEAEFDEDFGLMTSCLSAAETINEGISCQGLAVLVCEERIGENLSRTDSAGCIYRENRMLQRLRHAAFQDVLSGATNFDSRLEQRSSGGDAAFRVVLAAEAAWTSYAEAHCESQNVSFGAGTARSTADPACAGQMLAHRIFVLWAHPFGNGGRR